MSKKPPQPDHTPRNQPAPNQEQSPADQKAMLVPEKRKLTEQEKHEGWIENLRNEERTMKE